MANLKSFTVVLTNLVGSHEEVVKAVDRKDAITEAQYLGYSYGATTIEVMESGEIFYSARNPLK